MSTPKRSATYVLRLTPEQKKEWENRAQTLGEPLSDVLRNGAEMYLNARADAPPEDLSIEARVARLERQINDRHFGGKE